MTADLAYNILFELMDDTSTALLHQQAIQAALSAKWEEALTLNQQLILTDPENVDILNRTARAYFELGNLSEAKKFYQKSLDKDPYNAIAAKFLKRIAAFKNGKYVPNGNGNHNLISADMFIKEPGKSKLVNLLKVAEPQKLSALSSGTEVNLVVKNHTISVTDHTHEYLGVLPDDISHKLIRLIKGGNKYQVLIKSIQPNAVSVLIREISRSAKYKNQPSFPEATAFTYSSDHISLLDDENEDPPEGEEEEPV